MFAVRCDYFTLRCGVVRCERVKFRCGAIFFSHREHPWGQQYHKHWISSKTHPRKLRSTLSLKTRPQTASLRKCGHCRPMSQIGSPLSFFRQHLPCHHSNVLHSPSAAHRSPHCSGRLSTCRMSKIAGMRRVIRFQTTHLLAKQRSPGST